MRDLQNPAAMWLKGGLFLLIGVAGFTLLVFELGSLGSAMLLAATVWAFCRAYYFAFYVIEKYVDPSYRFSGLLSFARYWLGRKR